MRRERRRDPNPKAGERASGRYPTLLLRRMQRGRSGHVLRGKANTLENGV